RLHFLASGDLAPHRFDFLVELRDLDRQFLLHLLDALRPGKPCQPDRGEPPAGPRDVQQEHPAEENPHEHSPVLSWDVADEDVDELVKHVMWPVLSRSPRRRWWIRMSRRRRSSSRSYSRRRRGSASASGC